ncbi:VOC family protein [Rubrivivax sp. JA1024]|nr:VOC family protein [Rubrivivax sp. JA1024]
MDHHAVPKPRLTVVTLGADDMRASIAFYEAIGFDRRMKDTGDEVAFFDTGASVLALYAWASLAAEAAQRDLPRPSAFRGVTLAWNCASRDEVDAVMAHAAAKGATLLKAAQATDYGGYAGYFADPSGHVWEAVVAPGIDVQDDGRVTIPHRGPE